MSFYIGAQEETIYLNESIEEIIMKLHLVMMGVLGRNAQKDILMYKYGFVICTSDHRKENLNQ